MTCEWFLWVVTIGSIYTRLCKGKNFVSAIKIIQFPMDASYPSSNVSMHKHVLSCNFYGCTIHHILCYCMKLWNYINYSSMKWCIVILLNYNVYHLPIPYSWHKSMHSKVVILVQLKARWDVVFLTFFGT
jgi:hypothetical protein